MKRDHGKALERGEWTAIIPKPVADLVLLPVAFPRNDVGTVLPEELAVRFTTEISRTVKLLEIDGACIEVALDRGRGLSAGNANNH